MIVHHDDHNVVVKLTYLVRTLLDLVLIIPKVLIVICLTVVGTVWLAATGSFADLILNAIALEFVIVIDEVLFNSILPESLKEDIASTKLIRPRPVMTGDPVKDAARKMDQKLKGYRRSTISWLA